MDKKEIAEIKKVFSKDPYSIQRIHGCYVNEDKEKVCQVNGAFHMLPDEAIVKYTELAKKVLSGKTGKALFNLDIPMEAEMAGGPQHSLMDALVSMGRPNHGDEEMDALFDRIIENYPVAGSYYIIVLYGVYDIPGKATDGDRIEDNEDVYQFMLVQMCPVDLSKDGLCYDAESNMIREASRCRMVSPAQHAFLFPAFNGRRPDIHSVLYYSKKDDAAGDGILEHVLGCTKVLSAGKQKEAFGLLLNDVLGDRCTFHRVSDIQEALRDMAGGTDSAGDSMSLTCEELTRTVGSIAGMDGEGMQLFRDGYGQFIGNQPVLASALADQKKVIIESIGMKLQVDAIQIQSVSVKVVDGRKCLVVEIPGSMTVDGVELAAGIEEPDEEV